VEAFIQAKNKLVRVLKFKTRGVMEIKFHALLTSVFDGSES
jgi:hypothetical protein